MTSAAEPDAAPAQDVLEVRGLAVRREGRRVLEGVDLSVGAGSVHALVGPNGAGKSTLVAALIGHIEFEGSVRCHFRGSGRVALVPQTLVVDRTLPVTVAEFLATTRQRRPVCLGVGSAMRARLEGLLERVGLGGFARRRLGELSGGELRRVLVANALDPLPELCLLDEPSTGLDQPSAARLDELVGELRSAGAAVLIVSHEIAQVRRVADRVSWIDGRVRATGTPSEVLGDAPTFPFAGAG